MPAFCALLVFDSRNQSCFGVGSTSYRIVQTSAPSLTVPAACRVLSHVVLMSCHPFVWERSDDLRSAPATAGYNLALRRLFTGTFTLVFGFCLRTGHDFEYVLFLLGSASLRPESGARFVCPPELPDTALRFPAGRFFAPPDRLLFEGRATRCLSPAWRLSRMQQTSYVL